MGVDRVVRPGRRLASGSAGRLRRRAYIARGTVNFILGAEVLRRRKRELTGRLRAPLVNLMTLNCCTLSLEFLRVKRVSTCEAKQQQND